MSAWDTYTAADGTKQRYFLRTQPLTWFVEGTPKAYGCMSVKEELVYNGFSDGVDSTTPVIGLQAEDQIKAAQAHFGIGVDGIVGPHTALNLCHKRVREVQGRLVIPNDYLCKLLKLESNFDPSAIGSVDPRDRGVAEINAGAHPDVSNEEAFTFSFAIPWAGRYLQNNYFATGIGRDWDATLASYNVGLGGARQWKAAGKPQTGGPQIGTNPDGSPRYLYTTAHQYVSLVKSQTC